MLLLLVGPQVGLRVRVGVGVTEVDSLSLGQFPHRLGLAASVDEQPRRSSGVDAVSRLGHRAVARIDAVSQRLVNLAPLVKGRLRLRPEQA